MSEAPKPRWSYTRQDIGAEATMEAAYLSRYISLTAVKPWLSTRHGRGVVEAAVEGV